MNITLVCYYDVIINSLHVKVEDLWSVHFHNLLHLSTQIIIKKVVVVILIMIKISRMKYETDSKYIYYCPKELQLISPWWLWNIACLCIDKSCMITYTMITDTKPRIFDIVHLKINMLYIICKLYSRFIWLYDSKKV